jgi:hypothetical protein
LFLEGLGQAVGTLTGPPPRRFRVATGTRVDELVQVLQHGRSSGAPWFPAAPRLTLSRRWGIRRLGQLDTGSGNRCPRDRRGEGQRWPCPDGQALTRRRRRTYGDLVRSGKDRPFQRAAGQRTVCPGVLVGSSLQWNLLAAACQDNCPS